MADSVADVHVEEKPVCGRAHALGDAAYRMQTAPEIPTNRRLGWVVLILSYRNNVPSQLWMMPKNNVESLERLIPVEMVVRTTLALV
jgi:hypothetical protein